MSEPPHRYPHPLKPDEPIIFVDWHISSATEYDGGWSSPIAAEWWDDATTEERDQGLEILRARVAENATREMGRSIPIGEVSYTIHRQGPGPVRPDEEPT